MNGTKSTIQLIINDYLGGDHVPLAGMLDWLMKDKCIGLERLCKIAYVHFGLPRHVVIATLEALG